MSNAKTTGGNMYDCESKLRKGPWTLEEDNLLMQYISCHGDGRWNSLALFAGLKRTGKSCRLRWLNYLKPDIKRGNLTSYEQLLILELHSKWGNRWSKIAQHLPGRTDNEIKNYWRTRVQKQARLLKVDSNSKKFLEAIRTFWVPRLVEQMEQNSPSTPSSSISTVETQTSKPTTTNPHPTTTIMVNNSDSNLLNSTVDNETQFEIPVEDDDYYNVGFMQEMEGQDGVIPDRHVAGTDWCGEDLWSNFWNTDELWQFRKWEDLAPC